MASYKWEITGTKNVDHEGYAQNASKKIVVWKSFSNTCIGTRVEVTGEPIEKERCEVNSTRWTNQEDNPEGIQDTPLLRDYSCSSLFFINVVPGKGGQKEVELKGLYQKMGCTHCTELESGSRSQNADALPNSMQSHLQIFNSASYWH
jgi:hypothetical protein